MKPAESVSEFTIFAASAGTALQNCLPREGIGQMFDFYESIKATECIDDDLLFEWGTYDWGQGTHFQLGMTRQFVEEEKEGNDAMSQLHLTFLYEPSEELYSLGAGNKWCDAPFEEATFRDYVFSSAAFHAVANSKAKSIEIWHSYV